MSIADGRTVKYNRLGTKVAINVAVFICEDRNRRSPTTWVRCAFRNITRHAIPIKMPGLWLNYENTEEPFQLTSEDTLM